MSDKALKTVAKAGDAMKAAGDKLDRQATSAKGKTRKIVASAAEIAKSASTRLDRNAKALADPPAKTRKKAAAVPVTKA